MKKLSSKQERAIELAEQFSDKEITDESVWRAWLPQKNGSVDCGVLEQHSVDRVIPGERMFLLHSDCGITLSQIEAAGYTCQDVVLYAQLLHGLRIMTMSVKMWKEDLLYCIDGKPRPLLTLQELRDDGLADLAESLRGDIIRGWIAGKHHLPPGINISEMDDTGLRAYWRTL
jgi:hypothetical protein